ncbi:HNH endonuclease signature motif containing protein [Kytococcus sp. Marseille-QA3725]
MTTAMREMTAPDAALSELATAFAAAQAATDEVMRGIAALGAQGPALDREGLTWLVEQSKVLANRGDRIRSRSMDVVRSARESGRAVHTDDGQFAGRASRSDGWDTGRDQKLAEALGNATPSTGTPGPDHPVGTNTTGPREGEEVGVRCPLTAAAADRGLISERHALIIVGEMEDLPESLTPAERARVEHHLVELAKRRSPSSLRPAARRALEVLGLDRQQVDEHENEQVLAEETAALDKASFWMKDNEDGTWFGQFVLPELQAHMLKKAVESLSSPRRRASGAAMVDGAEASSTSAPAPAPALAGTGRRHRELDRRNEQGKALATLVDHLPGDRLGSKSNVILLVRTELETLRGETDRAGVTDSGASVSAQQVRRLASQAGIIPAVMGGAGQLLDLGQQRRCYSEVQRSALALRYSQCAEEACDRPFAWTEIHHADPWAPVRGPDGQTWHPGGGGTDLQNGIPLCGQHHRLLDDPRRTHTIERNEDGVATVRFTWRTDHSRWRGQGA